MVKYLKQLNLKKLKIKIPKLHKVIYVAIILMISSWLLSSQYLAIAILDPLAKFTAYPTFELLIGEYYYNLADHYHEFSQTYFSRALAKYLKLYSHSKHRSKNRSKHYEIAYIIGELYEKGKGSKQDLVLAQNWYNIALTGNIKEASPALKRIELLLTKQSSRKN